MIFDICVACRNIYTTNEDCDATWYIQIAYYFENEYFSAEYKIVFYSFNR